MRRQADRYTLALPVELFAEGRRQAAVVQDLSRSGMFVQLSPPLAVGTKVHVAMTAEGRRVVTTAKVAHQLVEADARALGRTAGIGIAFREPVATADQVFAIAIDRLVRTLRAPAPPAKLHAIVGDSSTRLLERMSAALAQAGFTVAIATTGMEVLAACLRRLPDVVIVDQAMPLVSGLEVLETMANDARLARIPVLVTSESSGEIAAAFEHGAADFIAKPYTAVEVIARARRLASTPRSPLRGNLAEVRLAAVLTMLEQEHTTGRLALDGERAAWIDLADGQIVDAGPTEDTFAMLMTLLDWTRGTFELVAIDAPPAAPRFAMPVIHVLLEHARLTDEAMRPGARPGAAYDHAPARS